MEWYLEMWEALKAIGQSPFVNTDALWLLIPVVLLWIIFEIYFDLHKKEPLGWNSALGNGVSMFWIGINLMTRIFTERMIYFSWERFIAVVIIMGYSLFVSYVAFAHKFKAKTVFLLASPTPIYFLSFITVIWAYGSLIITPWVIVDLVLLYPIILGIEVLIRHFTPDRDKEEDMGQEPEKDMFSEPSGPEETTEPTADTKPEDFKL